MNAGEEKRIVVFLGILRYIDELFYKVEGLVHIPGTFTVPVCVAVYCS